MLKGSSRDLVINIKLILNRHLLNNLRTLYQDGLLTRPLLEEAWQREIGSPLPSEVAEVVCVEGGIEEARAKTVEMSPDLAQTVRQLRSEGMSVDDIVDAFVTVYEARSGQTLSFTVKKQLQEHIKKLD
jgi:hypothetical protein